VRCRILTRITCRQGAATTGGHWGSRLRGLLRASRAESGIAFDSLGSVALTTLVMREKKKKICDRDQGPAFRFGYQRITNLAPSRELTSHGATGNGRKRPEIREIETSLGRTSWNLAAMSSKFGVRQTCSVRAWMIFT